MTASRQSTTTQPLSGSPERRAGSPICFMRCCTSVVSAFKCGEDVPVATTQ